MKKLWLVLYAMLVFVIAEIYILNYINITGSLISKRVDEDKTKNTLLQVKQRIDPSLSNTFVDKVKTAFQRVKQNENLKLTLLFEQKGYVQKLIDKEKKIPYITLVDKDGKKLYTFGTNYANYLYKMVGGKKVRVSIGEIKTGDMIIDREYFGVYNSTNSAEVFVYEK